MLNLSNTHNTINELPSDIEDLASKKQKFLGMGFNSQSIEACKIPTSPMGIMYSEICKNFPGAIGDNKIEELKYSYLCELQELGLDLQKYPIYTNFFSPISNSIKFSYEPKNYQNEFYFKSSHFLPYYAGSYRYSDPQKNKIGWGYIPESPEQQEIARIFKEFFKKHGHTEVDHNLLDIPLPIVGDHHGGEDEHPYRVYELLFGE
ncbi:MAG: hypothetical protein PHH70_01835 [Candidatus Gracilibacteria bacterium]|nr:hypothetical protein [Candidatus Gracilibacteria bacterium]